MTTNNKGLLKWVHRADLDVSRYDHCLENAGNTPVYACSWFLNIMASHWDVLVYGDYLHVMPVPNRCKWGISYVYQPVFAQQLGIFPPPPPAIQREFYHFLATRFRYLQYQTGNPEEAVAAGDSLSPGQSRWGMHSPEFRVRNLHTRILSLGDDYANIARGYDDYITQNLKKSLVNQVIVTTETDPGIFFSLQKLSKEIPVPDDSWKRFRKLMEATLPDGRGILYAARDSRGEVITAAFFLIWQHHAYYMAVCSHPHGRELRGGFALLDRFIRDHAGSNLLFDFEGSSVEGVDRFFAAFGAEKKTYAVITMNRLPRLLRLLKK